MVIDAHQHIAVRLRLGFQLDGTFQQRHRLVEVTTLKQRMPQCRERLD